MENDDIVKRLEFMDTERRKDKQLITDLQEQVSTLQQVINDQKREINHFNTEFKKTVSNLVRFSEYEEAVSKLKVDLIKPVGDLEKKVNTIDKNLTSQHKNDLDTFNTRLLELQNDMKSVSEIKKVIQAQSDYEYLSNQRLDELTKNQLDLQSRSAELDHEIKMIESNNRTESKRVSDLTIELTTLRKKIDEERASADSQREYVRKLEGQINDLVNREQLRQQEQVTFIETQSRQAIDRENFKKEWQEKSAEFHAMSETIQTKMTELQEASRSIKKSQAEFEEINQRLNRRINEITEMNRLMEERFRQEWVAFKADDQKRWTNYSLSQEETIRESDREVTKMNDRISNLEDATQDLLDLVNAINEETEKRIRGLLLLANENLSTFEKSISKKS
jgi:chromosome segregation ATPase